MRKRDLSIITSTILYLVADVLLCMLVCSLRQWPVWAGALVGVLIYFATVALVQILAAIIFKIYDKIRPTIDPSEYQSRFDDK